jgi:hypothetical protein
MFNNGSDILTIYYDLLFIYCNFSNVDKIKNGRITPGNAQGVIFIENPMLGMFGQNGPSPLIHNVTIIPNTEF